MQIFACILFVKIVQSQITIGGLVKRFHRLVAAVIDMYLFIIAYRAAFEQQVEMYQAFTIVGQHFSNLSPGHQAYCPRNQVIDNMFFQLRILIEEKRHQTACRRFELFYIFELPAFVHRTLCFTFYPENVPEFVAYRGGIVDFVPESRLILDQFSLFSDKSLPHCLYTQPHYRFGFFGRHNKVRISKDLFSEFRGDRFIIGYDLCRKKPVELCAIVEYRLPDIELRLLYLYQVVRYHIRRIVADRFSQFLCKVFDIGTGIRSLLKSGINYTQIPLQRHRFAIMIFIILQRMSYLQRCCDRHPCAIDLCPVMNQLIRLRMFKGDLHGKQISDPLLLLIEYPVLFTLQYRQEPIQCAYNLCHLLTESLRIG